MRIRRATWYDAVNMITWLLAGTDKNHLDPAMLYWTPDVLKVTVAEDEKAIHAMVPAHNSVTIESLAINPASSPQEKLQAITAAVDAIAFEARQNGVKQLNYISSDGRTDEAAMKHLGFEQCVCYVKKL